MGDQSKKDEDQDEIQLEAVVEGEETEEGEEVKKKASSKDEDEDEDEEEEESEKESKEDARTGHSEGDEDEDDDEEEGDKKKPLSANQRRKLRQREQRKRNEVELNFLRSRNEALERRLSGVETRTLQNEVVSIDQRIGQIDANIQVANEVRAEALSKGLGTDVVEAEKIRDDLIAKKNQLTQRKEQLANTAREGSAGKAIDPAIARNAKAWLEANPWYDARSKDEDAMIVSMIDQRLRNSGEYDPRTPEYWNELTKRAKKYVPHRFTNRSSRVDESEDEDEEIEETPKKKKNGGGPRFSTGGRETPLKPNQVKISAERKAAMIEAGVWDDKVLRSKYLKRYADWDKEHTQS